MIPLDVLQTVGIMASILIGAWQMRAHVKQQRSQQQQFLLSKYNELLLRGLTHPDDFAEIFSKPFPKKGFLNRPSYYLMAYAVNLFEQMYIQKSRFGTLTQKEWNDIWSVGKSYFQSDFGRGFWRTISLSNMLSGIDQGFAEEVKLALVNK